MCGTAEEKYARKQAVKREKRECRVAKKQTCLLFKREELKMDKQLINNNYQDN